MHHNLYFQKGVDAEIDSYIDSEEYSTVFGDDTVPFLRFRGAYTPCDSFNKQCALKGGWANSDKAMGGAALSGYNGASGKQMSTLIPAYITDDTTPYEAVAENTPLKSTAPNWYACPNPALAPIPAYISSQEVQAVEAEVQALQAQYDIELKRKNKLGRDALAPFRAMTREMGPMLERGVAYSGGDSLLANPFAKVMGAESALADGGCKSADYKRYWSRLENDTLSRLEKDLENAKADLRVLSKALEKSTPVTPTIEFPGQIPSRVPAPADTTKATVRPRITARAKPKQIVEEPSKGPKIGPVQLPAIPNPFAKKE